MTYRYYGSADSKPPLSILQGQRLLAVDVETYSTSERIPIGLGIAWSPTDSFYFPLLEPNPDIPWNLLQNPGITKVMHNAPFDIRVLREWDIDTTNVLDSAVMSRMNLLPGDLEGACAEVKTLTIPRSMKDVLAEHGVKNTIDLPEDALAIKCCQDVLATFQLYQALEPAINMDYLRKEMELLPILEAMSKRGIKLDQDIRLVLEAYYSHQLESLDTLCADEFGFSPHSPQQAGYILSKRGNFLPTRRGPRTGRVTLVTDAKVLESILHVEPLAGLILQARHLKKMLGTYLRPFQGMDRAYTYFHLDAITGRVSSSSTGPGERNLQNIQGPPPTSPDTISMRSMFVPDSGTYTDLDFSQIELRVLAFMANDRRMMEILENPDGDIHQETANFLRIPRSTAKNVTFAILYGAMAQTVMETAHIADMAMAQRLLDMVFRMYPGVKDWIHSIQEFGLAHGYVTSMGGRKISIVRSEEAILETDDWRAIRWKQAAMKRKASNYPIQASAGEIMKEALRISWKEVWQSKGIPIAHQIHDQIIWDGAIQPPEFDGRVAPFRTPAKVRYTDRWV